jgi:hypothetical protein
MIFLSRVEYLDEPDLKGRTLPMAEPQIRFDDGATYERMMGVWSRLAGDVFLDWLKPGSGLRWIDAVVETGPSQNS